MVFGEEWKEKTDRDFVKVILKACVVGFLCCGVIIIMIILKRGGYKKCFLCTGTVLAS